ncbi:MAG: serpin family protein [Chthoniobacteraceae bacterium]
MAFRPPFLKLVKSSYAAPMELLDFSRSPDAARLQINDWVSGQTHDRIKDLIPSGGLDANTSLVLVNAVYFKAAWSNQFETEATQPHPFHFTTSDSVSVPTMRGKVTCGYAHRDGYTALGLGYANSDLQFLILLPDAVDGLAALEAKLPPRC